MTATRDPPEGLEPHRWPPDRLHIGFPLNRQPVNVRTPVELEHLRTNYVRWQAGNDGKDKKKTSPWLKKKRQVIQPFIAESAKSTECRFPAVCIWGGRSTVE